MGGVTTHRRTTVETPTGIRVHLEPAAEAIAFLGADLPLQRIAVTEVTLRPGELLVEVELATVCERDLRIALGVRSAPGAQVLGHAQVGRVVACGPGSPAATVDGVPLSIGDRIVWAVTVDCGACEMCRGGDAGSCLDQRRYGHERVRRGWELSGGLATHVHLVARTAIVRARDWIPAEVFAPVACASASAAATLDAAARVRTLAGETVLVSGCDAIGLTAIAMAASRGAHVVAVDAEPQRRALATSFGAESTHRPGRAPSGYRIALEFAGTPESVADAVAGAGMAAVVVLAEGADGASGTVPAAALIERALTVRGVGGYRPEHLLEAVRFLERADHGLFSGLIGRTVPFADAVSALTAPVTRGELLAVRP